MSDLKNEGQRLLRLAYPERGDASRLAGELGTPPSVVSRWFNGIQKPVTATRLVLLEKAGIPIGSWDLPPSVLAEGPPSAAPGSAA